MPTIYIDCTSTLKSRINTGIQRVVRNIARHAPEAAARHGNSVKLVALQDGSFSEISLQGFSTPQLGNLWRHRVGKRIRVALISFIDNLRLRLDGFADAPGWKDFVYAPYYRFGLARCVLSPLLVIRFAFARLRPRPATDSAPSCPWKETDDLSQDVLLLADSSWDQPDCWPAARRFKEQSGHVACIVYDLIPLSHPQFCEPFLVQVFTTWFRESVDCADFFACISRSTEDAVRTILLGAEGTLRTGYFHLGSDLDLSSQGERPSLNTLRVAAGDEPIFLVVGSLEPRKNLAFILDAFERVWLHDPGARLILVGHNTWRVDDLLARIECYPRLGSSLFWIRDASDTDLEYLYTRATALIFASVIEGFGLPIVEAMQRGLPVLCSNIPVFREIADGKATFFSLQTTDELVDAVSRAAAAQAKGQTPARRPYPWLSWRESTGILIDQITTRFRLDREREGPGCE